MIGALRRYQHLRGGAGANLPGPPTCRGRFDVTASSFDPDLQFIGSDPWNTANYTGVVVPAAPSDSIGGARYLFLLDRVQFSEAQEGVQLVGIRQYAELVARIVSTGGAADQIFHREIKTPLFHPPDGNLSWHVMLIDKTWRDQRNPLSADTLMFQDSYGPALLFQSLAPYVPPNGGIPWGTPLDSSLGNIHELRYPYRKDTVEQSLRLPVPVPSDIVLFVSVRQNDPANNPSGSGLTANQFAALSHEEQFLVAYNSVAQYGHIAGSLIFEGDMLSGRNGVEERGLIIGGRPGVIERGVVTRRGL